MEINTLNSEELELLAAGYVLDDLDEAEMAQVEQLIQSSPAMREQIRQSLAVMGMLTSDADPISPPVGLKNKIKQAFDEEKGTVSLKSREQTIINLENWFQEIFEAGWQTAAELLETPTLTPAFRTSGVEGGRLISIGSDNTPIILIVRVTQTSTSNRDVAVEILPELEHKYLPSGLQLMLLDSDGDAVMEATTRQDNKNLKFEFTGTCGETFSIKLELFDNFVQEDFIL
ncbi:MAG: DUF1822 family protein [Xenococcaceae cyanobacterium]